ncbi:MAG TPA: DUF6790 family protein [Oscillospiraceae bacterium]|nr:DUF6790 family protein [Oscillospiraceae bacterium]
MYTIYVIGIMLVLPGICIICEYGLNKRKNQSAPLLQLTIKWFVFWALGVRALTAGLMQSINPAYTANLLQVGASDYFVIRELGCANISMGVLAICSLFIPKWRTAASLCLGLFLALCTVLHVFHYGIQLNEIVATISDIWAVIVAIFCIAVNSKRAEKG